MIRFFRLLSCQVLLLSSLAVWAQPTNLSFKHINALNGLSHSHIRDIIQDYKGYMWFGSFDGLNRYNGYELTVYKKIPKDTTSLGNSDIRCLLEDSRHNLWIGTTKGLERFIHETNSFRHIAEVGEVAIDHIYEDRNKQLWVVSANRLYHYDEDSGRFSVRVFPQISRSVSKVYEDNRGKFWVATNDDTYWYNRSTGELIKDEIGVQSVMGFLEDINNNFWVIAYSKGLFLYDRDSKKLTNFSHDENSPGSLISNSVISINQDMHGRIWIGTQNGGLSIFDYPQKRFYNYTHDAGDSESLSFNTVNAIYRDRNNNMWLGTFNGGVEIVTERRFEHYRTNPLEKNSLSNNNVTAFLEDRNGMIWLGTDGGGLNLFDREKKSFSALRHDPRNPNSISTDVVTYITADLDGNIWLGYWAGGLDMYNPVTRKFTHYHRDAKKPANTLTHESVMYVYVDKSNRVWAATSDGLDLLDPKTNTFTSYKIQNGGLRNYICYMLEDSQGNLWAGTWEGLHRVDVSSKEMVQFKHQEENSSSLSNDKIYVLHEDKKGRFWVGTAGGLNLMDKKTNTFTHFNDLGDVGSGAVYGILEDKHGNLWLSTGNGLTRFNPDTKTIRNFNINDGLQGNEFKHHSFIKLKNGEMLFGGNNGFNLFHPDRIKDNAHIPPVVFTDLKIFNSSVPIGKHSPLKRHISCINELTLSYKQSVFSVEYAALNYLSSQKNQYAYKLEGFDSDWIQAGSRRIVTYTNLNPGEYTLLVRGSNNDGQWNATPASLKISITPPFWKTWWFRAVSVLVAAMAGLYIYRMRIASIHRQKVELEEQVRERTAQIMKAHQEIQMQDEQLREMYSEMKDSIRAAKVIQQSILPTESLIRKHLPESFVLYKPKDVVSGDFYWFDTIDEHIIIAAVDCTGHGVSGAFMSINGHHLLNQAVYPHRDHLIASEVLDRLNEGVINELYRHNTEIEDTYGMDIAICIIEPGKRILQYAGANNPLYIVRDGNIIQVKADNFPVGLSLTGKINKFTNHKIELFEGDQLYIFSDGYADQIGGSNGLEKFKYPRFRELIVSVSDLCAPKQSDVLERNLYDWKGGNEQLDDILVIGFKI